MARNLLLLSTTTIHGSAFMEYCLDVIADHFNHTDKVLFIPYARPSGISHDEYTDMVSEKMALIGKEVKGIHEFPNPKDAIEQYEAVYIGGGNTFLLLKELYEHDLVPAIRKKVLSRGMRYMGSSAGTNVACKAINNTNDMPIVYPPSFDALELVPFNINPHYLDPDPNSKHKGETRETRINEFHFQSDIPVVGLREGSWLKIEGDDIKLGGDFTARIFQKGKEVMELASDADFSFLLSRPLN